MKSPLSFTEGGLKAQKKKLEISNSFGANSGLLGQGRLVPFGGLVRAEYFEHTRHLNEQYTAEFISLAENEDQMDFHLKIWPY